MLRNKFIGWINLVVNYFLTSYQNYLLAGTKPLLLKQNFIKFQSVFLKKVSFVDKLLLNWKWTSAKSFKNFTNYSEILNWNQAITWNTILTNHENFPQGWNRTLHFRKSYHLRELIRKLKKNLTSYLHLIIK